MPVIVSDTAGGWRSARRAWPRRSRQTPPPAVSETITRKFQAASRRRQCGISGRLVSPHHRAIRYCDSNSSLSLCSNRRNWVTITTVIARSEATWQSPGRMLDAVEYSKYGTFGLILLFYVQIKLIDCTGRLPRRGVAPPRNDTVVGSWLQPTNREINPNFAFCILHFVRQHDKSQSGDPRQLPLAKCAVFWYPVMQIRR